MPSTQIKKLLHEWKIKHWLRKRFIIHDKHPEYVVINDQRLINFASSDYLNISTHPTVKKACIAGVEKYGLGSNAAPLIAGYTQAHAKLEEAFAEFLNRDRVLLFNSGYHANLGVITTLANKNSLILADKYCHASLLDGMVLSRAKHIRYRHQDLTQAETLLKNRKSSDCLLITESVFSMRGNLTPVQKIAALARAHHALLVLDDAHGIGVLGKKGASMSETLSQAEAPCIVAPLGKAMGSMGAVVAGNHELIESLLQFAKTYRYSTALPPAVCHATLAALKLIEEENWRRQKLHELIQFFIQAAHQRNLVLFSDDVTPIKCISIGSAERTLNLQARLLAKGLFVSCIRPPTASKESFIRISLNYAHSEQQIKQLLDLLEEEQHHAVSL